MYDQNETVTHVYTAEGCRADTPAATTAAAAAAAAADLRVQFVDSPKRCDERTDPGLASRSRVGTARAILKTRGFTSRTLGDASGPLSLWCISDRRRVYVCASRSRLHLSSDLDESEFGLPPRRISSRARELYCLTREKRATRG